MFIIILQLKVSCLQIRHKIKQFLKTRQKKLRKKSISVASLVNWTKKDKPVFKWKLNLRKREEKARKPYKDDDEEDHSDEPYVDKRSLKKELSRFASEFEQKVDRKAEEKARSMIEQERQSNFLRANPDFKEILSPEVIQKFAEKHPEQAEALLEMPDNFSRQKLLYQNIKALGVNRPAVTEKTIQQKIDENRRSPYYQPSGDGTPPYASTGDFSAGGQKNAYSKMQELIKGRRG